MKKILFVNACVRPESRTMILARHLLSKLEGNVEELDLGAEDIKNLDLEKGYRSAIAWQVQVIFG